MKNNLLLSAALCLLSLLTASSARAQFTILSQTRTLSYNATYGLISSPSQSDQNTAAGAYDNTLSIDLDPYLNGGASQNSIVSSSSLSGSGSAYASCNADTFSGDLVVNPESTYTVEFAVASPTAVVYADQYTLTEDDIYPGVVTESNYAASLTSSEESSPIFYFPDESPPGADSFSGVLEPGQTYTLQATATANVDINLPTNASSAQATFQFSLTPVPEPASDGILLFSTGLLLRRLPRRATSTLK